MAYDDPDYTVRREHFAGTAGGAATTEYGKFRSFQKMRLNAVHAVVTVAGTATTHKFDVFHGTASVGVITLGTAAAGATGSAVLNRDVNALDQISVKSGADADGEADIIYEYEVTPFAVQS